MDGLEAKAREYQVEETLEALEAARVSTAAVPLLHPLLSRACPLPAFLHASCVHASGWHMRTRVDCACTYKCLHRWTQAVGVVTQALELKRRRLAALKSHLHAIKEHLSTIDPKLGWPCSQSVS